MTAVVYAFATKEQLAPEPGAAPFNVLARQLPRLIVAMLNGDSDRGVRFFPFLGQVGDRRQFLDILQPLPIETLLKVHGQRQQPRVLVDGMITGERLSFRLIDGGAGRALLEQELEFSAVDPRPAARRIAFEVAGALGWAGDAPTVPEISGPALGWYLIARDELLALEANLIRRDPLAILRPAREALAEGAELDCVRTVALELTRKMVQTGLNPGAVADFLCECAPNIDDAAFRTEAAVIVDAAAGFQRAGPLYLAAAALDPLCADAVVKAAAFLYQSGEGSAALTMLRAAHEAGNDDPAVIAQLAASEEEWGDLARRNAMAEKLLGRGDMPAPVTRLAASCLIDQDRSREALALLEPALEREPEFAGLWLERGRALLGELDGDGARVALERALALELSDEGRAEATRLLRFVSHPRVLTSIRDVEVALADDRVHDALAKTKRLLALDRTLPEAWLFSGICRQRLGQPRRAIAAFRRALRLQPNLGEAHNRLGILLAVKGDNDNAHGHLRRAVELAPNQASAWIHLAQVSLFLDRRDEAAVAIERAERLGAAEQHVEAVRAMMRA